MGRNEEIQKLRDEIKQHLETINSLNGKIKELEGLLEDAKSTGAEGEQKLRDEIRKLLAQIEEQKVKFSKDFKDLEERKNNQRDKELNQQKDKYEKMIEELKKKFKNDQEFMEKDYKKRIEELEADLKMARKGFEAERDALEKKRTDM